MALKDKVLAETMKLSQNPAVAKLLADERFMRLMVGAMSMPGRVATWPGERDRRRARGPHAMNPEKRVTPAPCAG